MRGLRIWSFCILAMGCANPVFIGDPTYEVPTRVKRVSVPTKYSVEITSSPSGAYIVMYGKLLGQAPLYADISAARGITGVIKHAIWIWASPSAENEEFFNIKHPSPIKGRETQYLHLKVISYNETVPKQIHFDMTVPPQENELPWGLVNRKQVTFTSSGVVIEEDDPWTLNEYLKMHSTDN